jgi:hypothetical protein
MSPFPEKAFMNTVPFSPRLSCTFYIFTGGKKIINQKASKRAWTKNSNVVSALVRAWLVPGDEPYVILWGYSLLNTSDSEE